MAEFDRHHRVPHIILELEEDASHPLRARIVDRLGHLPRPADGRSAFTWLHGDRRLELTEAGRAARDRGSQQESSAAPSSST